MELPSTRRRFWRGCGIFGVGLTACTSRVLARQSQSGDEAVAAIRAVLERQEADWNKGDLDSFLTGYWNSPKLVFQSGGDRFDGWEAMRDRYRKRYKAEGKAMGQVAFSRIDIEPLGLDAALVRGAWRLDPARRLSARRAFHADLPALSRRLENRPRSHLDRGSSKAQADVDWPESCAIATFLHSPMETPVQEDPTPIPPAPSPLSLVLLAQPLRCSPIESGRGPIDDSIWYLEALRR